MAIFKGGCVVSHVRTGREIFSPMIPLGTADLILGFEPGEAVRCLPYLKEGGVMVASVNPVMPVTASLKGGYDGAAMVEALRSLPGRVILVDTEAICRHIGSAKVANVALLGAAAASGVLDVSLRELEETLTNCERMVASAAPLTPISSPKMKIGSRIILHTAPMVKVK